MTDKTELPGLPEPFGHLERTGVWNGQPREGSDPVYDDEQMFAIRDAGIAYGKALATRAPGAVAEGWQVQLADALDTFWNAAVGAEREGCQPAGAIAQGFAAVANRLREQLAASAPAESKPAEPVVDEAMVERFSSEFDRWSLRDNRWAKPDGFGFEVGRGDDSGAAGEFSELHDVGGEWQAANAAFKSIRLRAALEAALRGEGVADDNDRFAPDATDGTDADGFPGGDARAGIAPAADSVRLDWMEKNLCRIGEVKDANGNTVKLARVWTIMGELETLRDTVDAAMTSYSGSGQGNAGN
jgi:hypothetical protein